jgi:hypothetical protein
VRSRRALEEVDGGALDRVTISNITMDGVASPIFIRLGNRGRKPWAEAPARRVGTLGHVVISNVVATGASTLGCAIAGIPGHQIENVTLRDINITFQGGGTLEDTKRPVPELAEVAPECTMFDTLPAYAFYARHVDGLNLDNVQVGWDKPDLRPAIVCDDTRNLTISCLRARMADSGGDLILLNDTENVMIRLRRTADQLGHSSSCDGHAPGNQRDWERPEPDGHPLAVRQPATRFRGPGSLPGGQLIVRPQRGTGPPRSGPATGDLRGVPSTGDRCF